jgi:hypothetical protein
VRRINKESRFTHSKNKIYLVTSFGGFSFFYLVQHLEMISSIATIHNHRGDEVIIGNTKYLNRVINESNAKMSQVLTIRHDPQMREDFR